MLEYPQADIHSSGLGQLEEIRPQDKHQEKISQWKQFSGSALTFYWMPLIASDLRWRTLLACLAERPFLCSINVGAFTLVRGKAEPHLSSRDRPLLPYCLLRLCVVNNAHQLCSFIMFYTRSPPPTRAHQLWWTNEQWPAESFICAGMNLDIFA